MLSFILNKTLLEKIVQRYTLNAKFEKLIILYNDMNIKYEKNHIEPSLYENYGLTRQEILEKKEVFDLYDNNKNGIINTN